MNHHQMENQHYIKILFSELEKEVAYQSNGGTSYRKCTVELVLGIAKVVKDFRSLLNRENAKQIVRSFTDSLDDERIEDVSKMLFTAAKEIYI